jgi:hypothetical protein
MPRTKGAIEGIVRSIESQPPAVQEAIFAILQKDAASPAYQTVAYFRQADLPVAEQVLALARAAVAERQPPKPTKAPKAKKTPGPSATKSQTGTATGPKN